MYEPDRQNAKKYHHRAIAVEAEIAQHDCPRKQEAHFQIEDDEQDGDEIVAHVELHARIVESIEPALVGGELFRVWLLVGDEEWNKQERYSTSRPQ